MTDPETQDRIAAVREYARALEAWIAKWTDHEVADNQDICVRPGAGHLNADNHVPAARATLLRRP